MQKCKTCALCTCSDCHANGRYDGKHNLGDNNNLDWIVPHTPKRSGLSARHRKRTKISARASATPSTSSQPIIPIPGGRTSVVVGSRGSGPTSLAPGIRSQGLVRESPGYSPLPTFSSRDGFTGIAAGSFQFSSPQSADAEQHSGHLRMDGPVGHGVSPTVGPFAPLRAVKSVPAPRSTTGPSERSSIISRLDETWRTNPELRSVYQTEGLQATLEIMEMSIALGSFQMTDGGRTVAREWMESLRREQHLADA